MRGRLEERAHHEDVIFQPPAAFRKAESMRVEEFATPELVRRQQGDERLPVEIYAGAVATEERARDGLAVTDDLADDDVGSIAYRRSVQPLERLVSDPVVVVDEIHEVASRHLDTDDCADGRASRSSRCGARARSPA